MSRNSIGLAVLRLRTELGWTQAELATGLGCSPATVSALEHIEPGAIASLRNFLCRTTVWGPELRVTRKLAGLTQASLASTVDLKQTDVSALEALDDSVLARLQSFFPAEETFTVVGLCDHRGFALLDHRSEKNSYLLHINQISGCNSNKISQSLKLGQQMRASKYLDLIKWRVALRVRRTPDVLTMQQGCSPRVTPSVSGTLLSLGLETITPVFTRMGEGATAAVANRL